MLDTTDNTTALVREIADDLVPLSSLFIDLLPNYSVRANNVLKTLRGGFSDDASFLAAFLRMSWKDISKLNNCGRKTIQEIVEIQSILRQNDVVQAAGDSGPSRQALPSNIDSLLPMISSFTSGLSVRTKNAFYKFLEEHNNSLSMLYATISDPSFKPGIVKNIGRGSVEEIRGLLDNIKGFLEEFPSAQSVEEALAGYHSKTLNDVQIPLDSQEGIHNLQSTLGHFPLFAAINAYFEGLEGDARTIIEGCINMHENQTLPDRAEVAAALKVTPERIRQKRNKLVESLEDYFASYRFNGFVDKCPYDYQMRRINEEINATEGTNFNLSFVNWVLSSTFEEVTVLGDVIKTITGYYDKSFFLCLVPTDLCQYMDFVAFTEDIEARLSEKRIDEVKVSLRSLINNHLKTQYCEDEMSAIETTCRSILFLHYPVEVDFGQVIFKPNTRKNNPIIVEEILRAAGHPMTLEEIYDEFVYQYPERYTELNGFRGNITNNPNIVPIGRSSTYILKEWEGEDRRGGSIRSIIVDYLNQQEQPIASVPEIVEYVCKFRPTTDEKSIVSNISLEKTGVFAFFYRNGERFVGLASGNYAIEFFPVESSAKTASANSMWYPKMLSFLEEKGFFPFSSGGVEDEERQMSYFWMKQERLYANSELDSHALSFYELIIKKYGHLRRERRCRDWKVNYELVKIAFETKDFSGMDDEAGRWLARNLRDYQNDKDSMLQWKREGIEYIISFIHGGE